MIFRNVKEKLSGQNVWYRVDFTDSEFALLLDVATENYRVELAQGNPNDEQSQFILRKARSSIAFTESGVMPLVDKLDDFRIRTPQIIDHIIDTYPAETVIEACHERYQRGQEAGKLAIALFEDQVMKTPS